MEILRGKKKLLYGLNASGEGIRVSAFTCLAPLSYFEKTRSSCAHHGQCREEGLLIALLSGKKKLDASQISVIQFAAKKAAPAPPAEVKQIRQKGAQAKN